MSIVSNASLLINLARTGGLDLLRQFYGELAIPEAVWNGEQRGGVEEARVEGKINDKGVG